MDEDEYRATYHELNKRRCVFEKAINSRICDCSQARRFNLADREGVACRSTLSQSRCTELIQKLRDNSRFALRTTRVDGPLPHSSEIKIQNGGLLGLQRLCFGKQHNLPRLADISTLVSAVIERFNGFNGLRYDEIVKSVVGYEARSRCSRHKKK